MEEANWQTWVALAVVVLTVSLLLRSIIRKRGSSCGDGCGCSGKEFKTDLERAQKDSRKEK